jgi:hypothetical protein
MNWLTNFVRPKLRALVVHGRLDGHRRGRGAGDGRRPRGRARGAADRLLPASGGARMQEGILSLMQMPRTTIAVAR